MEFVDDPAAWGYLPLSSAEGAAYQPDPDSIESPFILHLVGSGWMDIPKILENVVQLHRGFVSRE